MGRLVYENSVKTTYDDRALAHLQLAILAKLRFGEPFALTWKDDASIGGGRTTVWLHTQTNLVFKYETPQRPLINRARVHALTVTANSPTGLYLVHEPSPASTAAVA